MKENTTEINIQGAADWLLHSGIQKSKEDTDLDGKSMEGGFSAWYDPNKKEYAYTYPEISGYAITTLLHLYDYFNDDIYLKGALQTGVWFLNIQEETGAFPTAVYGQIEGFKKPEIHHTFDIGMIFNGLALLAVVSEERKYLDAAKKAADFCIDLQSENGSIPAQISITDRLVVDTATTWSTQSGAFHAKLAIGLINIYSQTEEQKYLDAANKLCEYALTFQQKDGQFYTYGDLKGTNLHPHAYAAEGLYVTGMFTDNKQFIESAERGTHWAVEMQSDGLVPRHKHDEALNYNERVDILSQILRLSFLFTGSTSPEKRSELLTTILSYQYSDNDSRVNGAFRFGKMSDGTEALHANCWVTQFALQALILSKSKLPTPFYLV